MQRKRAAMSKRTEQLWCSPLTSVSGVRPHCAAFLLPRQIEGGSAPPKTNTHFTFLIFSTRRRERGGRCNINSPQYYVLICSSSWLLHMTCAVICIAPASHFLISQSLSTESFFLGIANFDELFWRSTKQPCLADMQAPYMMWYIVPV